MHPLILFAIFAVASAGGYFLVKGVPGRLHLPLLSGINAISGITALGALVATAAAVHYGSRVLGYAAIILSMAALAGGFAITHRVLKSFPGKKEGGEADD